MSTTSRKHTPAHTTGEYRYCIDHFAELFDNPFAGLAMVGEARRILQELAPQIAPFDVATQEQMIDVSQFAAPKLAGTVMGILGAVQFLIAAIGMYGLLSYLARLQAREIGVRLALGATTQGIVALYLSRGGRLALRGLPQGSLGALAVVWVMRRFFPGFQSIPGYNLTATIGVIALVTAVAALSVYLPVRRVLADDPMAALRQE